MIQDLRFAFRSLLAARGFTAAALLTLAVAIGANTVVYGVVDALLLRPLPFGDRGGRLVTLHSTHPTQARDWDASLMSYADLLDVRESARTLEDVQAVLTRSVSLSATDDTERVAAASVTPGLFRMLGITPQRGRDFEEADAAPPGFEPSVILSDAIWRRLYGADPAIVGRGILVNGRSLTVIGIMPPRFAFPERQQLWLAYRAPRDAARDGRSLLVMGVMRRETTIRNVQAEMAALAAGLASRYPATNRHWGIHVLPFRDLYIGETTRRAVATMLIAVLLVLALACANIASLLVARGIARRRELTVRAAVGASRWRLIRLLMAESLLLSLAGAALGVLLASWGVDAFVAANPEPPPYWARIELDGRVILFTMAIALAAAMACGLLPALRAARTDVAGGDLTGSRTMGATPDQRRLQRLLVVGQVALSLTLLVAATLLARSTVALLHADPGFRIDPLLSMRVYLAGDPYDAPHARAAVLDRIVDRLRALPGAAGAAATGAIPIDDGGDQLRILADAGSDREIGAQVVPVTATFFETLGVALIDGRPFTREEVERPDTDIAIVSARLASVLWPSGSAAGRILRVAGSPRPLRIVGVAPDIVFEEINEQTPESQLIVYVPYARAGWRSMALMVRASGDPAGLAAAARRAVHETDAAFASYDMMTMRERRMFTSWAERFIGRTFSAFAIAGLLLACLGTWGLTAYSAAQRTREIGVRLAIGATRGDIVRLLLGAGTRLALAGAILGVPLAIVGAQLVQGLLYNVSPWSALVWTGVPAVLLASVLAATFVPAHFASRLDPCTALRRE